MNRNGRHKMVVPQTVHVDVAPAKPKRHTSHGHVCACGSEDVEIVKSVDLSRKYPAFMDRGRKRLRRYCRCKTCHLRWTVEVDITPVG